MIQIIGTILTPDSLELKTTEKVRGKKQMHIVHSVADMDRLYYFWVRLYIIERMTAFLNQRIYVFKQFGFEDYINTATALLDCLQDRSLTAMHSLCRFIADNEATIASLAPGEKNVNQFKYYNTTIRSIIDFCKEEGGVK